jgi:hypothetical protein
VETLEHAWEITPAYVGIEKGWGHTEVQYGLGSRPRGLWGVPLTSASDPSWTFRSLKRHPFSKAD